MSEIRYEWQRDFTNDEANTVHADAFEHRMLDDDWQALVDGHSLGWVTAREQGRLVGFVDVIWDGLVAGVIDTLDVTVMPEAIGGGIPLFEGAYAGQMHLIESNGVLQWSRSADLPNGTRRGTLNLGTGVRSRD